MANSSFLCSSQTKKVEERVDQVHNMLEEVHEWFIANLKSTSAAPGQTRRSRSSTSVETGSQLPSAGLTFSVSELDQEHGGSTTILCCPRATFHPSWHTDERLFQCRCAASREVHKEQLKYLGIETLFSLCLVFIQIEQLVLISQSVPHQRSCPSCRPKSSMVLGCRFADFNRNCFATSRQNHYF